MIEELMIMIASMQDEEKLIEDLEKSLQDYKAKKLGGGGITEEEIAKVYFSSLMLLNKLKAPTPEKAFDMMREFTKRKEWMNMKPKEQ